MNSLAKFLVVLAMCFCTSLGLPAQLKTSDHRHFTMPPIPVTEASGDSATAELDTPVPAQPAILNFDQLPPPPWALIDCTGRGSGRVERGILTINSPSDCHEYSLDDPEGTGTSTSAIAGAGWWKRI